MPSEAAHAFKTSGSTATTATKEEFRLSPMKGKGSIMKPERDKGTERERERVEDSICTHTKFVRLISLPYTKHCATNLHLTYTFSIFSGAMYSPCANLKIFFFLYWNAKFWFTSLTIVIGVQCAENFRSKMDRHGITLRKSCITSQ